MTRPRPVFLARAFLLAGLLALAGAHTASAGDGLQARKRDLIFHARVDRAIHNGAHWVAGQQQRDGSFALDGNPQGGAFPESRHRFGITALCTYTLADCGYAADQPVVQKALEYLRHHEKAQRSGDYWPQASSYSLALLVLALHELFVKPENRRRLEHHDRYGLRRSDARHPCGYPTWARRIVDRILDWMLGNQAETGLFRYPGGFKVGTRPPPGLGGRPASHFGDEDLSNTQYVLLALWVGSRCGYAVPPAQLARMARRLLAYQQSAGPAVRRVPDPAPGKPAKGRGAPRNGHVYAPPGGGDTTAVQDHARGFCYTLGAPVTGSMTTAGLSSLAILKAMLMEQGALTADLRRDIDRGLWDAIAWMQANFEVDGNPGMGRTWQYYYLYGMERAGVIAGKRFFGSHDWYREGAEMLVADQVQDGRWAPRGQLGGFGGGARGQPSPYRTDLLDTCFALLFLKRATLTPKKPVLVDPRPVTRGG